MKHTAVAPAVRNAWPAGLSVSHVFIGKQESRQREVVAITLTRYDGGLLEVIEPSNHLVPIAGNVIEHAFRLGVNGDAPGHSNAHRHGVRLIKLQPNLKALRRRHP